MRPPVRRWLWPAFVLASAAVYVVGFSLDRAAEFVLLVPAAQVVILLGLELWLPDDPTGAALRDPGFRNDLAHNLLGNAFGGPLSNAVVVALVAGLASPLAALGGGDVWPTSLPSALQAAIAIFLADGLDVVLHRITHVSRTLWPLHAVHHAGDGLQVMKSGRNHFANLILRAAWVIAPLSLLGAPAEALLAYVAAGSVFGPIGHASLPLEVPRWLHRWVMTPAVHHVHHARSVDVALHNYCNVFPFWDWLFGSFLDPSTLEPPATGLDEDPNPPGFVGQVLAPLGLWRISHRLARGAAPAPACGRTRT